MGALLTLTIARKGADVQDAALPDRPLAVGSGQPAGEARRPKVLAVVGIQTGFTADRSSAKYDYAARRAALRATWVPPTQAALDELQRRERIVVRFVIGHSPDAAAESAFAAEEAAHGGMLRLPLVEGYGGLPAKTVAFLRAATRAWDAEYVVKVDDDVYFRLDHLPHAIAQWRSIRADYVGCMKTGQIIKSPRYRWFEPQHVLLGGGSYFTHAWGSVYVLSGQVAADLAAVRDGSLRHFANEDVTIGSWMLAFNVTHYDDRRLCETNCTESSLAAYDIPVCAGLCDAAAQLPSLHASAACRLPATPPTGGLPLAQPVFLFDRRPDPAWEAGALRQLRERRRQAALGVQRKEHDTVLPL